MIQAALDKIVSMTGIEALAASLPEQYYDIEVKYNWTTSGYPTGVMTVSVTASVPRDNPYFAMMLDSRLTRVRKPYSYEHLRRGQTRLDDGTPIMYNVLLTTPLDDEERKLLAEVDLSCYQRG